MIIKVDLEDKAVSLGEVIAQRIADKCYKDDDYEVSVRKEYDELSDQEKFILWNYAAVYVRDEETDLEDFVITNMIDTCDDLRYDDGLGA